MKILHPNEWFQNGLLKSGPQWEIWWLEPPELPGLDCVLLPLDEMSEPLSNQMVNRVPMISQREGRGPS